MSKRLVNSLLSAVVLALSCPVHATTGTDLLGRCSQAIKFFDRVEPNYQDAMFCIAYVRGVLDTLEEENQKRRFFCVPPGGYEQSIRVVVRWLTEHPEQLHHRAPDIIIRSLKEALPCA
jgi:hypothetical protein